MPPRSWSQLFHNELYSSLFLTAIWVENQHLKNRQRPALASAAVGKDRQWYGLGNTWVIVGYCPVCRSRTVTADKPLQRLPCYPFHFIPALNSTNVLALSGFLLAISSEARLAGPTTFVGND